MHRRVLLSTGSSALITGLLLGNSASATSADREGARVILDEIKSWRNDAGRADLTLQSALESAAQVQTFLMQKSGSSTFKYDPGFRAREAGYLGQIKGEVLAETYESASNVASRLLEHPHTKAVILNPRARDVGIFGLCDSTGQTYWSILLATSSA